MALEHVFDDLDQLIAVTRLLLDQRKQQQLEIAVAEHAATATPAAAAHLVPAAEEIGAAAMSTEWAAAGVAIVMMVAVMTAVFEAETEVTLVVTLVHGMEEVVETHG
ncbi:hypothetical protein [Rhodanobacter sp. L36]|uniref:hypothetical protein n=1 Tax=Rhodanobacter sp. L36 TaxID=1747221 RepID=UPI0020B118BE|nr:hypothetical protein [Rhodanobacter sp. L36]